MSKRNLREAAPGTEMYWICSLFVTTTHSITNKAEKKLRICFAQGRGDLSSCPPF